MCKALVRMALIAEVFFVLAGTVPAAQAANCLGVVDTTYRRCDFKREDGFSFSACTEFVSDFNPNKFRIFISGGANLRCTCEASGSFTDPKFNHAKDFLCGIATFQAVPGGYADAASGKIVGTKVKKGQYINGPSPALSWVFECEPDPLCP